MANNNAVQTLALGLTPFQTLVGGFLGAMTFTGLYLTSRGDAIPMALQLGFVGGITLVLVAAFQSFSPSTQVSEIDLEYFDKKKEKKEQKKAAKAAAKAAAEEEALRKKAENDARKLEAKKLKLAEDKARKAAEKAAALKKEQAKLASEAKVESGGGKKKKKKKKNTEKAAAATAAAAAVKTEAAPEPEADEWTVAVDKFAVRKAKKSAMAAETVVEGGPNNQTVTMTVDKKHYKVIIGAGSKNINALQAMFSCKIQLPNKNSSDETVTITGENGSHLASCKDAIAQLVEKGYCKALSGDVTDVTMTVSNIGLLIGPGGKNVGTIREKTGVEINLPPREDRKKDEKNKDSNITLIGDLVGIQTAMNAINQLMLQGFCDLTHPDWVKIQLAFPGSMLGILLGAKGSNLRTIEKETETTIKVPNAKTEEDKARLVNISILGAIENVEKARARIAAVQTDFVKKEVDFPSSLVPSLIGPKGSTISKIQSSNSVRINIEEHIWDPDLRTVSVEGFEKDCAAAIASINEIMANNSRVTVEFPTSRIGILIGKAGATVNKIKDDCSVRINVGNHEWDESVRVVSVDGLTANVTNAVAKIEALKVPPPKKERVVKKDDEGSAEEGSDEKPKRERRERRKKQEEATENTEATEETAATE